MASARIMIIGSREEASHELQQLLEGQMGSIVCTTAVDGIQALEMAKLQKPDVVVLDSTAPPQDVAKTVREIHRANPRARILICGHHEDFSAVKAAIGAGAHGYVFKFEGAAALIAGARELRDRKPYFSTKVCEVIGGEQLDRWILETKRHSALPQLTARETEVLRALLEGRTGREIAALLGISPRTVQAHRNSLLHKFSVHSTVALVRYAIENRILKP